MTELTHDVVVLGGGAAGSVRAAVPFEVGYLLIQGFIFINGWGLNQSKL